MKKVNKKSALFLSSVSAALVASAVAPGTSVSAEDVFPDVPSDHPYHDVIHALAEAGVVTGYEDGTFQLYSSVTRAEAAVMMARILDLDMETGEGSTFSDVYEGDWYAASINALHEAGYISGMEDGTFQPKKEMTRGEFAQLIVEAYGLESDASEHPFEDVQEGAWYEDAIATLYNLDLVSGQSETKFGPKDDIRRGDFAWLLANTDYEYGFTLGDEHFELSLMHTNDTHAHLDDVAKRVTAVNEVRAENPDALLLDAGDVFSGTLYFNEFKGQADLEFMNMMGYDLMTLGNHEFDLGSSAEGHKALADFVEGADFPFVSSNVNFSQDENMKGLYNSYISKKPADGEIYNSVIKEVGGEEVGFFGLTTEETADISSPEAITFDNYIDTAEERVKALEALGVDKIVALTHIGYDDNPNYDNDQLLAEVDGIDVIVGGHSHSKLSEPVEVTTDENGDPKDPTVIVQAGQYGDYLGTLDVEFDDEGVVVGYAGDLIDVSEKEANAEAAAALEKYTSKIEDIRDEESGAVATEAFPNPRLEDGDEISVRNSETALGNLITDGMLDKAKEYNPDTVAAFQNSGGIREAIDKGPITIGEILTVMPFGNTLATMELSGAEIMEALEHSVSNAPKESGGFLQVSGLNYTYDSSLAVGERVQSVELNVDGEWVALDESATYTVATNAFTAKGGDGYDVFANAYEEGRVTDLGSSDWENFRDYVAELGEVTPVIEDRIVDVASEEQ
ncbi:5'-nucleotidase C-terminal domain-containing protein [Halobacillus aidingensis]|uniref:5'-nucleotidase/2',3'-cyclic-nucleotide 2'-phosphodiesterase / 3'-nucleotidase / 5'-nucleotidase n=2 Tax=Halobacillus TaxID=45667 RepID=A0A1H0KMG3_HALAD|nr:5'-nucleotidase C-terminal domain-containing protein [Halobacillus aidingensis]SDO57184.1 5'-nucleotidase/2',3'-cyclic-nucleotide 2'-phosphodiesterase / 3'-nucleotidase / 5'-nucleotidase [Halobacillus aidingensis]